MTNFQNLKKEVRMPDNRKDKSGGNRPGGGRPKGSKNINSMASVKKLQDLNFDPIERMVTQYEEISKVIASGDVRIGSGAYAQLVATQGTLINNLMQYGYKKVPEKIEQEITENKPIAIRLNLPKASEVSEEAKKEPKE